MRVVVSRKFDGFTTTKIVNIPHHPSCIYNHNITEYTMTRYTPRILRYVPTQPNPNLTLQSFTPWTTQPVSPLSSANSSTPISHPSPHALITHAPPLHSLHLLHSPAPCGPQPLSLHPKRRRRETTQLGCRLFSESSWINIILKYLSQLILPVCVLPLML